jgi:hypothetical protein
VDKVKAAKPMLGIAIQKAVPEWNDADKTLTLDVADPLPREQLRTEASVQLIERIAKEIAGCSLRVIVSRESRRKPSQSPGVEAPPPPDVREPASKKAAPPVEKDPRAFVQDAMQMFNASLVKTSSGEDGHALPSPVTRKRAEGGS